MADDGPVELAGRFVRGLVLAAILVGPGEGAEAAARWVTGYYAAYSETQPGVGMAPTDVDYSILTHVIHWPVVPLANGTFDPAQFGLTVAQSQSLVTAAHAAGAKALLGFGGDAATVGNGWRGATAPAVRPGFIAAIVALMQARGYDGVDINWEELDSADPADQVQFPAFIQELRAALDLIAPRPLLTMPPTTGGGAPAALVASVAAAFDQINLQTYVMSGPYPGWVTWFNSPLHNGGFTFPSTGGPVPSADDEVARYEAAGIAPGRLAIGVQFDGAVWSGGSGTDTGGPSRPRQELNDADLPAIQFVRTAEILANFTEAAGYVRHFDDVARVPWLGRDGAGGADDRFVSYDDPDSIREKLAYVDAKGLGGIFVFELAGDFFPGAQGDARHPLLAALRRPASSASPALSLQLNGTDFGPGQTLVVTATLTPGTSGSPVDAYVVLRLPDATLLSLGLDGALRPGLVPIVRDFTPVAVSGELLRYTFAGPEPPGPYTFLSGLTQAGTLVLIGSIDQDPLTFAP